jgi:flagellar basal-body rod protein FlgB
MDINGIPLFSMLKSRMSYIGAREQLISQNVANADTSGYTPQDLQAFDASKALESASGPDAGVIQTATTEPGHLQPQTLQSSVQWKVVDTEDSQSTLSGNKVTLEDEMAKMSDSRMDYEAAVGFYQKAMSLLQMAAKPPGK